MDDSCCHPLPPLLTFFILITFLKSPKSKAYKEKNPKKEQKISDGYVNIQLLPLQKNILFLLLFPLSFSQLSFLQSAKKPHSIRLRRKMKKDKKGRGGYLTCMYTKET